MCFRIIVFILIISSSCQKGNDYTHIKVIGHGGMGLGSITSIYHDNSFESVDLALQFPGVDGVEVDVQMDLDGELWLCHDIDLNEELGVEGAIPFLHTEFLEQQEYQTLYSEPLCKLRELFSILDSSKILFIDIKSYDESSGIFVSPVLFKQSLDEVLSAFNCQVKLIIRNGEWISTFVSSYHTFLDTDSKSAIQLYSDLHPDLYGVVARNEVFNKNYIDQLKSQNLEVYLYEMRSPFTIREALENIQQGLFQMT